ncbi:sce7726 family protein, partial [Shewanella sp. MBTL60-007]|uniref:sce7726 family protein n=1 Tax=Shewanella sp. MBTL60-007 TaxID=2815911 RepID=UPI001C7FE1F3
IKRHLIDYIIKRDTSVVVGAEVPFQYGTRRADVISILDEIATAYEIKGAGDSTERLDYQIKSYKQYFDYCFVVCEKSNLNQIRKAIGHEIGILLVDENGITELRKSKQFKRHDKETLASTLPTNRLRVISQNKELRSKHQLCEFLAKTKTLDQLRQYSRSSLNERYKHISKIFRSELGNTISSDDILTITRMPPSNLVRKS